ncbi:MAG: CHASE2 domain-containing protein [Nitrospirae bacterium]|nr:CHASE2 domain-containing protein [Nitrospirota bacterium]
MTAKLWNKIVTGKISKPLLIVFAIGTIISLLAAALGGLGAFNRIEDTALEIAFLKRPPLKADPAIMSIDIDDEAIATLGRWPWPLERHKSLVDLLKLYKSRSVIFTDIDISKTAHNAMEESAAWLLKDAIKDAYIKGGGDIMNAALIDSGGDAFYNTLKDDGKVFYTIILPTPCAARAVPPKPKLSEGILFLNGIRGGGFNTIVMDKQGMVFRYPLIASCDDTLYPSLALAAAIKITNSDNVTVIPGKFVTFENAKTGRTAIPIDNKGQMPVNWAGSYKSTFQRIPLGLAAGFIVFQEAKNELRKYDLKTMPDPRTALDQVIKELKKYNYTSKDKIELTANLVYNAALIENHLNSTGCTVKDAIDYFGLQENWTRIGNQIKFNNYLLVKYDETEMPPVYEDVIKELGFTPEEAEAAMLKTSYDLVMFHLGSDSIPLVRPLYFESAEHVVDDKVQMVSPLILKDRIVFYGLTATGLTSQNPTPFMKRHPMLDLPINVLNSILTGKFLHELPRSLNYAITFVLAYGIVVLVLMAAPIRSGVITVSAAAVYLALSWHMFTARGMIMPVSEPVFTIIGAYFGGVLYRYFKERNERRKVRQMFSTMVSPEILKIIEKTPGKLNLGGEIRRATMFSSDVSGFTTISEGVTSRELADILNVYLTPMSNIIMSYDGYVDKYEGDAIKADFGVPLSDAAHAWKACWAALHQQEELFVVGRMILLQYGVKITARMGVNTGEVLAGNMGSEGHIQYTVMGPAAAVAEELEPANKLFDTWIMIGHDTCEDAKAYITARCLGEIQTHHGTETVYELAGWNKEKFLSYWEHRPVPKLLIESFSKLRPEKILGYNYYFKNKTLPELPMLTEIRELFSELAALSVQYMQIRDTINIVSIWRGINELQERLKPYEAIYVNDEAPETIRYEIAELSGAAANETIPYKSLLLSQQVTLKQLMAYIATLTGKISKADTENFYDIADRLLKGIESINKRINCAGDPTSASLSENLKDLLLREDWEATQTVNDLTTQYQTIERTIRERLGKFADDLRRDPRQYHRLVAEMCTVPEERQMMFRQFENGLSLYKQRKWDDALDAFKQCLEFSPDDGPSRKYIKEIEHLKQTPPSEDWTGAFSNSQ